MKLALALVLIARPVAAEELTFSEDAEGITLHYHNEVTTMWDVLSEQVYRFESSRGPVVFKLTRTRNNDCAEPCPDLLEVMDTPPGTVAVPPVVELPEEGNTTIRVIEFSGM